MLEIRRLAACLVAAAGYGVVAVLVSRGFTAATTPIAVATPTHSARRLGLLQACFVWKIFEISMIRVRTGPPQSGQGRHISPNRRESQSPSIRTAQLINLKPARRQDDPGDLD